MERRGREYSLGNQETYGGLIDLGGLLLERTGTRGLLLVAGHPANDGGAAAAPCWMSINTIDENPKRTASLMCIREVRLDLGSLAEARSTNAVRHYCIQIHLPAMNELLFYACHTMQCNAMRCCF